jgi:hypothetical protein
MDAEKNDEITADADACVSMDRVVMASSRVWDFGNVYNLLPPSRLLLVS